MGDRLAGLGSRRQDPGSRARGARRPTRRATRSVAPEAGLDFPATPGAVSAHDVRLVDTVPGGGGTDFGVPSAITPADRRPVDAGDAARLAALVEAAWIVFDRVAARPRPSCARDRAAAAGTRPRWSATSSSADHAYAREIGIRLAEPSADDRAAVEAERQADARRPRPAVGRLAAGRPALDRSLRRPADRLARPRPRLGDRGPDGAAS